MRIYSVGCFNFAQSLIRAIQSNPSWDKPADSSEALGNLLITGATASVKGSAKFSTFAASKFALRALAESIAREYDPLGIHVAHFVIDGLIVTPATSSKFGADFDPASRMDPDAIAQVYLDTARQKRSVFSFNVDLRPSKEKW
jgi:NAD(P)-dependent dehydrogenase (short-subunit alcohol dehydrogenase family)